MRTRSLQRGATLIVMATVLVLGFAWFTVGALGKTSVTTAEREAKTAAALQAAKKALLGHVAHYAALTNFEFPGRMPCPESLNAFGTPANEGEAPGICSNTIAEIGRLPWKTLGIDQLRDGDGEPLWYALSPNFHPVSFPLNPAPPNPYLNFGTPAALPFDGANVVAVVIAPGRALQSNPCNAVNQQVSRYATPLQPNKFFECGNATGAYTNPGSNSSSNDRVLAITRAEWADAIAGAVTDRIQRQVAPAMNDFRETTSLASWGRRFLPYASVWNSTFNWPPANNMCGNQDIHAGMPPTATATSGSCNTSWTSASVSGFVSSDLDFRGCTIDSNGVVCEFEALVPGLFAPRISLTAPRIAYSFRSFDPTTARVSTNNGVTWQPATAFNFTRSVDPGTGSGNSRFNIAFPLLTLNARIQVSVAHPVDALLADPRTAWYLNNGWDRYTYYAISQAAAVDPSGANCDPSDVGECLTVMGMPSPSNDKRLVLVLMGRAPIAPATWPSASIADYMEGVNAIPGLIYESRTVTAAFNDRLAACPYRVTDGSGVSRTICD